MPARSSLVHMEEEGGEEGREGTLLPSKILEVSAALCRVVGGGEEGRGEERERGAGALGNRIEERRSIM